MNIEVKCHKKQLGYKGHVIGKTILGCYTQVPNAIHYRGEKISLNAVAEPRF
jgi:hypothetical protein